MLCAWVFKTGVQAMDLHVAAKKRGSLQQVRCFAKSGWQCYMETEFIKIPWLSGCPCSPLQEPRRCPSHRNHVQVPWQDYHWAEPQHHQPNRRIQEFCSIFGVSRSHLLWVQHPGVAVLMLFAVLGLWLETCFFWMNLHISISFFIWHLYSGWPPTTIHNLLLSFTAVVTTHHHQLKLQPLNCKAWRTFQSCLKKARWDGPAWTTGCHRMPVGWITLLHAAATCHHLSLLILKAGQDRDDEAADEELPKKARRSWDSCVNGNLSLRRT